MTQLVLKEWRPGLKKISAVKLLQERAGLSLTSAKEFVDRLLKHETVIVAMNSATEATELARDLTNLGVICEVRSNVQSGN
jgi:ribosomal protein L7/L12